MKEKIEIVEWLVNHGYHLFGESTESFADRLSLEQLKIIKEGFKNYKKITTED